MKKYLRWVLVFCGIFVLTLGLLSGCGEKDATTVEGQGIYWNVEGNNYLGNPGEVPVRRIEPDGYYYVKFAHGGKQERYRVAEEVIKKGLDLYKISVLVFDEAGVVVDFKTVEEATGGYFVKECFVETIEGNTITCNSAPTYEGFRQTFEYPETMNIYLVGGDGPLVGMETTIKPDDEITIICDKEGNLTDCFVAPLEETPTVYFSKTRLYNSTTKLTTRESNLAGIYTFDMAVNGEPVTVRVKTQEMASKMDSFAARNMILTFDEDGYVESAVSGDSVCGVWGSWFNVLKVENGQIFTVRSRQAANLGTKDFAQMARNFVAYDVSPHAEVYGQVTELQKGDTIHCLKNSRGQIAIAFVVNRKQDAEIYWNVTRMYSSTTKETTREPNEEGWYEIVLTKDGQQYTLKTKDRELITYIDKQAAKHCGVKVENGIIVGVCSAEDTTGGGAFASWYDITDISPDGKKLGILRNVDTNIGNYVTGTMADDCKVYDVSGMGSFVGEITEVRIDDRVHCVLNDEGKIGIIFIVRRLCEPTMYWNVEQKYNDTTKSTTRGKWADGYYRVTLAVNGKQVTYKVADKAVMNSIDKRPYLRSFGADIENGVITRVHEPGLVTGGGGFASWADITSVKDGVITAVKTTKSDTQKIGTVYTAKMAEDCQVYDVTELAKLDSYIGVKTKPRVGDRIYGHLNLQGEIEVLYIVGNRLKSGYLAWNFARKYDYTNKVSTRVPDEDGWYKVDLAVNGKHVVWKTKDKEIINKIDGAYWSGLTVNKDGEIQAHYPYNLIYGGYSQASWYDVTRISGSYVTAKKTISANDQGKVVTFKRTYNCKVYDVSENYVDHKGEETTLQVGDRIHVMNASNNIDARVIYIVWRPDRPGEPDHFHCQCVDGSANGVGGHVCDESFGWSAWTNPRKLPTSGNWYLATDVNLTAGYSVSATSTLNLCLNGHTVNGPETARVYYNSGNLTITDCTDAGQIIANSNTNGSIFYAGPTAEGSVTNFFGGTFKNSLEQMSKSGAIAFVGDKVGIANVNIYGGTFEGANNTYPGANFYMMGDSYMNIYGGKLIGGETLGDGANIYVNAGQINVCGGELIAGTTSKQGGNIYMSTGTLQVSGGSLTGGTVALVKAHAEVTGGTIQGGLDIQGQTTVALSGNPVISGGTEFNLRLSSSENVTLGDFTEGAEIYVRSTVLNMPIATLSDPADKGFFFCDDEDATIEFTAENQLVLKANHTHCVCGTGAFDGEGTHTCDANAGWTKWTDATRLPTASGYYYLATDVTMTAGASIGAAADVHLCLNGHTVNTSATARVYYSLGKLTLTDCKPVAEQGQIVANSNTNGAVIYVGPTTAGSELTVYGGTYKSTVAQMSKSGSMFFVGDKVGLATMNIYGGTFQGTGNSYPGGNFYVMGDSYVNMYGGTITGGKTQNNGGNIVIIAGQWNMYGGTISNGTANLLGGNIYMSGGSLNMYDGTITGGTVAVAAAQVSATGGTISGGLQIQGESTLSLSGKPVIFGSITNLSVADGTKITVGDLTDGAKIGISLAKVGDKVGPLTDPADKICFYGDKKYAELLMDEENKLYEQVKEHKHCICGGAPMAAAAGHVCDETVQWQPISLALETAGMTASTADFGKLPSGNYYLDSDIVVTGCTGTTGKEVRLCLNGYNITTAAARVFPSFKESTLEITDHYDATTQTWGGTVYSGSSPYAGIIYTDNLTRLNIYGGNYTDAVADRTHTNGGLFAVANETSKTDATKKAVMNVYGGNIHGAKASTGGLITVFQLSELNIYGGTLQNGTATSGGLIAFSSESVLNIFGGTFKNGIASSMGTLYRGGAVYINKGTLNVKGGTFVGNAAYYGGAIYAIAATENAPVAVNLEGGKFYTGTDYSNFTSNRAYHFGGNIYMEGSKAAATLNIKAGTDIGYGHTTNSTFDQYTIPAGGNIYVKNVTVNMTGGTVTAGRSVTGGNIYVANGSSDYEYPLTIYGGTVSGGQAIHAKYPSTTYKDASNKTVTVYPVGGNISVHGNEKVVIRGGTVTGGTASHAGGNIALNDTSDLEVSGGQILGGTAAHGGNIFTNNDAAVKVKISGGKISGGTLDRSKAVGTGRCIRLHTKVKLTLEGKPEVEEITFVTSASNSTATTKIDATGMQSLEKPIKICLSATTHTNFVFADVDEDLSGSFLLSAIYWDATSKVESYNASKGHAVYDAENSTLSVVIHATKLVAAKAATCTEAGHGEYRECTVCDYHANIPVVAALDHDWDEGVVTTPPTSEAEGEKTFTCLRAECGKTKTEPVEKLETE